MSVLRTKNPVSIYSTLLHFWAILRHLLWFQIWFIWCSTSKRKSKPIFPEVPASLGISVTNGVVSSCLNLYMQPRKVWCAELVISQSQMEVGFIITIGRGRATDKSQELLLEVGWMNPEWLKKTSVCLQRRLLSFLQKWGNLIENFPHKLVIDRK